VSSSFPDRVFAFDEFGPLTIRPHLGAGWVKKSHPGRLPANYHKLCGVRQFHGCYSMGDDTLWGVVRARKSAANTLAALKSIRAARPDGAPIYILPKQPGRCVLVAGRSTTRTFSMRVSEWRCRGCGR
jgi:hypothetical protein